VYLGKARFAQPGMSCFGRKRKNQACFFGFGSKESTISSLRGRGIYLTLNRGRICSFLARGGEREQDSTQNGKEREAAISAKIIEKRERSAQYSSEKKKELVGERRLLHK